MGDLVGKLGNRPYDVSNVLDQLEKCTLEEALECLDDARRYVELALAKRRPLLPPKPEEPDHEPEPTPAEPVEREPKESSPPRPLRKTPNSLDPNGDFEAWREAVRQAILEHGPLRVKEINAALGTKECDRTMARQIAYRVSTTLAYMVQKKMLLRERDETGNRYCLPKP